MKEIMRKYKEQFKEALQQLKTPGERKKQIPNILTASRLLAPFVIIPSVAIGNFAIAGISTLLFSATDMVDGYLARKLGSTSELGKDLDATTDKVFVGTLMLSLIITNSVYLIPFILEGTIAGINIYKKIKDKNPESHMIGKVKMTSLYLLIASGFLNMYLKVPTELITTLFVSTVGLQTATAIDYSITKSDKKNAEKTNINNIQNDELKNVAAKEENLNKNTINEKRLNEYKELRDILMNSKELEEKQIRIEKSKTKIKRR